MARSAIHPGEHLAEEFGALGMSAAELARQLGVSTNRITEILNRGGLLRAIRRCGWLISSSPGRNSG
jgi:plasmid maintenance system antidote protein VapI